MGYKEDFTKRMKECRNNSNPKSNGIKVLNNWSVGENIYEADSCSLSLWNEDEQGNEVDSCTIYLSDGDVKALIKALSLSFFLKGE